MAVVSLFWDTNMAAVTSCEIMYISKPVGSQFGQMVRKTMVSFIPESCLPFAQIIEFYRKTAAKA